MAVNLIRNAKVYFTTNVNSTTGEVLTTGHTASTTYEIQVLDGMSFSQNSTLETITLNESGSTPARGQRSFATVIEPGDWSFSTYIRPRYQENTITGGIDSDDKVTCEEKVLWNAMLAADPIGGASPAYVETAGTTVGPAAPYTTIVTTNSNKNQLQKFALIVQFDDTTYFLQNCAIESATVDFGIDQIGTIAWTGKCTKVQGAATTVTVTTAGTFATGLTGTYQVKDTSAKYITNKLSTISIVAAAVYGQSAQTYSFPITAGSITIANNLSYLTPSNVGVVNQAIEYFTGVRAISGTLTAYLRTGATNSAGMMSTLLTQAQTYDQNLHSILIGLGGSTGNVAALTGAVTPPTTSTENRVVFNIPLAMLQIPTLNTEQVVSTTVNFTAQGGTTGATPAFDIDQSNELKIVYFAGPAT